MLSLEATIFYPKPLGPPDGTREQEAMPSRIRRNCTTLKGDGQSCGFISEMEKWERRSYPIFRRRRSDMCFDWLDPICKEQGCIFASRAVGQGTEL